MQINMPKYKLTQEGELFQHSKHLSFPGKLSNALNYIFFLSSDKLWVILNIVSSIIYKMYF